MALTAISAYTGNQTMREVVIVAVVFVCTNIPSISFWTVLGQQMRKFLTSPVRLRTFNIVMALLLVATLIPILRGH